MRKPKRLPREQLAPYTVLIPEASPFRKPTEGESTTPPQQLDWATLFGNGHPVEVEVGFGKGMFLVAEGARRPEVNFFGIEIVPKYQMYAANRLALRNLTNVKTSCADAKRVLANHIPPASVDVVHVFFPDPWWKNRHKKRTLFTADFADSVARVLKPTGHLHFVTDVADYFTMVTELLSTMPYFVPLPPPEENTPAHDLDYLTNFERKFRKEGRPIYRSRYEVLTSATPPSV